MWVLRAVVLGLAVMLAAQVGGGGAQAATLTIEGGRLTGATGVVVGGRTFDVAFVDGRCVALFSGCDSVGDFDFADVDSAILAARALLDQVLIDVPGFAFDSDGPLITGCGNSLGCSIEIPIFPTFLQGFDQIVTGTRAFNVGTFPNGQDSVSLVLADQRLVDTSGDVFAVYARFTPVPVPAALPLLLGGLGLMALVGRRRRG